MLYFWREILIGFFCILIIVLTIKEQTLIDFEDRIIEKVKTKLKKSKGV